MNDKRESFKNHIMNEIILPNRKNNIKFTIESHSYWSNINYTCKFLSYLLTAVASIIAFLSEIYPEKKLGNTAGLLGLFALKLSGLSLMISKFDHIKTIQANKLLKTFGIEEELDDLQNVDLEVMKIN